MTKWKYLNFKDADFRRIANEIGKEAKALQGKNINWFERLFFVKRGTMNKYTVTRWMNKQINGQINYERSKYSNYVKLNTDISKLLRKEIIKQGGQSKTRPGIKLTRDLEILERELESASDNLIEASNTLANNTQTSTNQPASSGGGSGGTSIGGGSSAGGSTGGGGGGGY